MRTGKISSGFEFAIEESALDNMELVDALAEIDEGNTLQISNACTMLLGKAQKKKLYDHLRTKEGNVPAGEFTRALLEIFEKLKDGKNS